MSAHTQSPFFASKLSWVPRRGGVAGGRLISTRARSCTFPREPLAKKSHARIYYVVPYILRRTYIGRGGGAYDR